MRASARQQRGLLPHNVVVGRSQVRHYQHRWQLQHSIRRSVLLAVRDRCEASQRSQGLPFGRICWFTIPFALATSLGLCALALRLPITSSEAGSGLVPPAVATYLFGKAGSVMMATMLFMAITSTGSAEGIAVSSLVASSSDPL